jgi:hypothetical protein
MMAAKEFDADGAKKQRPVQPQRIRLKPAVVPEGQLD